MAGLNSSPACSGVFFRLHCRHQKLFDSEYKRSNRNRGTKILRCFPHCCPGHVERSYCGSSLELAIEMHQPLVVDPQTLFVFARFETVDIEDAPVMGERYSLGQLLSMSKNEANPDAPWTQGVLQLSSSAAVGGSHATSNSTVFVLNGHTSSKWYYHWESGANKARRLTKHVLKAYVLYRRPQSGMRGLDDMAQVICTVSSPPFTLVSYRRAWEGLEGVPDALGRSSPMDANGRTHAYDLHRIVRGQISQAYQNYANSPDPEARIVHPSREDSPEDRELIPEEPHQWIWERLHSETLRPIKDLAVIYYFVSRTPMAYAMQSTRVREHMCAALQDHWARESKSIELLQPGALLSLLFLRPEVALPPASPTRPATNASASGSTLSRPESTSHSGNSSPVSPQVEKLLVIVAKLVIWMLSDENIRFFQAAFASCASHLLHKEHLRSAYLRFVGLLCQRVGLFWAKEVAGGSQSQPVPASNGLRMLSEHILSLAHVHSDFQHMWPDLRETLESPTSLLWESFIAQARETFVRNQHKGPSSISRQVSSELNGCWHLETVNTKERVDDSSITATLLGMKHLQQVSLLVVSDQTLQIRAGNSLLRGENTWMTLVCDDTPRTASVLPLGFSTLVGFQLRGIDYVGSMNGKRSRVQLEFYWWPSAVNPVRKQRATRVVFTIKALTPPTSIHLTMEMHHATLTTADLQDLGRVELGSARERLGLQVQWSHAWRATAQFVYAEN